MLSETELARLIVSWKNQLGEEIKGRMCVPVDSGIRVEMYKSLIKTLIETHNYTQEDLEGNTYRRVMEASINSNSNKVSIWRELATTDWMRAVDVYFPQEILKHDSSNDPEPKKWTKKVEVDEDPRMKIDNPIDRSIFEGLPPVNDPIDEEFLKMLKEVGDE